MISQCSTNFPNSCHTARLLLEGGFGVVGFIFLMDSHYQRNIRLRHCLKMHYDFNYISTEYIFKTYNSSIFFTSGNTSATQMQKLKMMCLFYLNIFSCQQFFWRGRNRYKEQQTYVAFSTIFLLTLLMNMSQYFYNVCTYKKMSYK